MWLSCLLPKRSPNRGSKPRADRSPSTRFRPRLEELEDRWLPSQIGLTVTSLLDDTSPGTLRSAIQAADKGSQSDKFTIGFSVSGTIDLQTPLPDLNNSIAIQGPGASSLTIMRDSAFLFTSPIITVDVGQTASLSGLTIANGNDGGIANHGGTLTLSGCTISGNSGVHFFGDSFGGGIWSLNDFGPSTLTVIGCTISGNSATFGGGIVASTLAISDSIISGNSAHTGGGIDCFNGTISGCTLSGNSASFEGGSIDNDGQLTVSGCTISGNSATFGGGLHNDGTLTLTDSTLSGNSALGAVLAPDNTPSQGAGGAIFNNFGGTLTVSGCTLSGNFATGLDFGGFHFRGLGGGIANVNATLDVRGSTFSGNFSENGGAIYGLEGTLTLSDCTLSGNTAIDGGGIYNNAFVTLDVRGSTFSGNSASDSGGGIYNLGTATIQQSTLSGNTAGSDGGGIFNGASGTLAVKDSTVLNNVASLGADIYNLGALTLNDSTVGILGP
jgi:predicted outer membrane repeat protein